MPFITLSYNVLIQILQAALMSLLPQIYDGKKKPEVLVDGWNVYFFDDLKTLVSTLWWMFKINAS